VFCSKLVRVTGWEAARPRIRGRGAEHLPHRQSTHFSRDPPLKRHFIEEGTLRRNIIANQSSGIPQRLLPWMLKTGMPRCITCDGVTRETTGATCNPVCLATPAHRVTGDASENAIWDQRG
jgi:hypothetical protein